MAASLLASLTDINTHLPVDKAQIEDAQDDGFQISVYRLIRARLASTIDVTVINGWTSPVTTPEIIRDIAGKLIAAMFYATLVAEDDADGSRYAQDLYNSAIADLDKITQGTLVVIGVDGNPIDTLIIAAASFWPNDTSPSPSFAVEQVWS